MWKWKSKSHKADEDASGSASSSGPAPAPASTSAPPPAYGAATPQPSGSGPLDLPAVLGAVSLGPTPPHGTDPTEDACLAHLRLLTAFNRLKNETGYRDGLWEIWDSRANVGGGNDKAAAAAGTPNPDVLVKLREKRWAVYVGRAVDRYAVWWRSFVPDMLLERDMVDPPEERRDRYEGFPRSEPMVWNADMLPPLDVLLVWHAHMLNPRIYLEDCLRYGHGALWAAGMPWPVVNQAISGATFDYVVSNACVAQWEARTSLAWCNEDDPDAKKIRCPSCPTMVSVPWTTCGQSRDYSGTKRPGIAGEGYADGHLTQTCPSCSVTITHESLRAAKFRNDIQASVTSDHAMPGTILDLHTGLPKPLKYDSDNSNSAGCPDQLFPARLARRGLLAEVVEMLKPGSKVAPSMMVVRDNMEENFTGKFADSKNLKEVMNRHGHKKVTEFRLSLDGRRQTRKMMSRYWENSSPFAIDLVGCVMRQGTFTEKMCKLDWLHFPTARNLVADLLKKYTRFVDIIAIAATTKDKVAVPTLDVDLTWHTHQLSPQSYFVFTLAKTGAFVDHNDKVDEDKLSTAFEWTSKTYQEKYGEVYSQCKCWYCEILEAWHAAAKANNVPMPPMTESAHVSSHPAVHTNETTARRATTRPIRLEYRNRLEETHSKARKRATKNFKADSGKRMGPRGEDRTSFWGKDVEVEGPWASSLAAVTTSAMYPAPPGFANMGPGSVGSCATGTCGGATGCGSELLGMCTAGCVGSGWFGGNAGCAGMGTTSGGVML